MSEDKIIEIVKDFISYIRFDEKPKYGVRQQYMAIENLLDLYQQEKEKNNNLIKQLQEQNTEIQDISRQLRQEKEKNNKIQKYVRSNEWAEDYEKSSCRIKILRILED